MKNITVILTIHVWCSKLCQLTSSIMQTLKHGYSSKYIIVHENNKTN